MPQRGEERNIIGNRVEAIHESLPNKIEGGVPQPCIELHDVKNLYTLSHEASAVKCDWTSLWKERPDKYAIMLAKWYA